MSNESKNVKNLSTKKSVKKDAVKNSDQCCHCLATPETHKDRIFIKEPASQSLICSGCVNDFSMALAEISKIRNQSGTNQSRITELPDPMDIYDYLSQDIIGQEEAKKQISIAVAHHYRRIQDKENVIGKSNILIAGPTGTGKTELARSIATYLKVPFAISDATTLTSKGFVGEDVEVVIQRLLINCNWDIPAAEHGIIFIDEIDKLAKGRDGNENTVGTKAVQEGLLRLMESDKVKINKPGATRGTNEEFVIVDTSKILFICAGAFVGLDNIINSQQKVIGISPEKVAAETLELQTKHFESFGLIPEFLGRLPKITTTKKLTENEIVRIMTEPRKSIIKQYQSLFSKDNIQIEFSDDFCLAVAKETLEQKIGVRGIRQIMEKRMSDVFFKVKDYKNKHLTITSTEVKVTHKKLN